MEKNAWFPLFCLIILVSSAIFSTACPYDHKKRREEEQRRKLKLFVFGDSYADTGNSPRSVSISWKPPYGITFPGKPSGRFSDGRVLADYIASFLGIESPLPYEVLINNKYRLKSIKKHGINFAHGGTGVFDTMVDLPNMTTQIDLFQQLIDENVYNIRQEDINSSIALVSLAGNDYATYLAKNGNPKDFPTFTRLVINQLIVNIKRIKKLGIKKLAVTGIEPMGCLPRNAASYQKCEVSANNLSISHNSLLKQNLFVLNHQAASPLYIYLDLYNAFLSALKIGQNQTENLKDDQLKPCCVGEKGEDCGSIDENGTKKYVVCENPEHSFFWDSIHPSNHGWRTVYSALKSSLSSLML